jgi:cytochrome c oxidase cbb3-type subunit 2
MTDLTDFFHHHPVGIVTVSGAVFLLLTVLVAIRPAVELKEADASAPQVSDTAAIARGRAIYLAEGCGYCHSQLVRGVPVDTRYGRPSSASDYAREAPPLMGTERTGPDLANVGHRQPSTMWNLYHLFDPRSMVPQSVMPAFPWYFRIVDASAAPKDGIALVLPEPFLPAGKVALPKPEALDLVAYLMSVKQR